MLEWTLIIIGAITVFFVFLNAFTQYGDKTPEPILRKPLSLDDPSNFVEAVAGVVNSSVEIGSSVKILTNGHEFLPDFMEEVKNAKKNIYITNFIWDDGEFSRILLNALIEKAKEGVEVRLLLDGIGSRKTPKALANELEKYGGKVAFFRPITWWNLNRIDRRTHIRDYVIDDTIVYLGGMAIADTWLRDAKKPGEWHDYMYKTQGEMAKKGSKIFKNIWHQTTGEHLISSSVEDVLPANIGEKKSPRFVSLFSSPSPDLSSNLESFMWLSIMAAKKCIHIQTPYLLPSSAILEALRKKSQEGVKVEILLPGENTDTLHTRWASHTFYTSFLQAGIKLYEYQPSRMHAKVMTIDEKWSVIGSANLDNRSCKINLEWIVGIYDEKLATDIEAKFAEDKSKCIEITKTRWSKTSYLLVPVQHFALLFSQQF